MRIETVFQDVPFKSSFLVFRLNCLHHEARSLLDGGELEGTGSGEAGKCTGSMPGCDLPVTMIESEQTRRRRRESGFEEIGDRGNHLRHRPRVGNPGAGAQDRGGERGGTS
jgi:hypothetical protein